MGKRSDFERIERDFYETPLEAFLPLVPHLTQSDDDFIAPCVGGGLLVKHMNDAGFRCHYASDIEPGLAWAERQDALTYDFPRYHAFVENPPWDRKILHPLIERLSDRGKTWLLFDADWIHTRQSTPYLPRLRKIVSIGRVKWIPDSKMTGKDNCAWYCFTKPSDEPTQFYGRVVK